MFLLFLFFEMGTDPFVFLCFFFFRFHFSFHCEVPNPPQKKRVQASFLILTSAGIESLLSALVGSELNGPDNRVSTLIISLIVCAVPKSQI